MYKGRLLAEMDDEKAAIEMNFEGIGNIAGLSGRYKI